MTTTVIFGMAGAGTALGIMMLVTGWRGRELDATPPPWRTWIGDRLRRISLRRASAALVAAILVAVATGWVVGGVLAAAAIYGVPYLLGGSRDHRIQVARIEAIASWTEMMRDTLVAAAGLEQTLRATAPIAPTAIRPEITELAASLENGDRLTDALRHLADRLADPTADLVIAALILAAEHQARQLAELLSELAREAREQASMRMRVAAGRATVTTSVRVIVITTIVFAAGLVVVDRPYLAAFDSITGQLMLLVIGALFVTAFVWLGHISRLPAPERFLTHHTTAPSQPAVHAVGQEASS